MNAGHDIAMHLRTAYWTMHRGADACLQPLGVTANQFVLLALLSKQDGITQRELVQRASSDANTVRAMLVTLEEKGLVARKPHPTDGRARSVTLSPKGRRTFKRLWAASDAFRERLQAVFRPAETATLLDLLARLTEAMSSPDDDFDPSTLATARATTKATVEGGSR